MKKLLFILFFLLSVSGFSQTKLHWEESFDQAAKVSGETGKPILLLFSGSDWCKSCIKLKTYILETDVFAGYAQNFVLYNADFPYRKKLPDEITKENEELAEKYNPEGAFPKVVFLSSDRNVLGSTGFFDCNPDEYIKKIESAINK